MNENAASRASAIRCPGGRRAARPGAGEGESQLAGQREDAAAIDIRLDEVGDRLEPRLERLRFAGLHEAEMALRQRDFVVTRENAHDRDAQRLDRIDDEPAMALAADAIDDRRRRRRGARRTSRSP